MRAHQEELLTEVDVGLISQVTGFMMDKRALLFRLDEIRRGWTWCDRESGRPASALNADFRLMRASA